MVKKQVGLFAQRERGGDTRARLLEAAIDVFGRHGYDGASTRLLAEQAGVNLAAIPYHFGGKQGVYQAAAEWLAGEVGERIEPVLQALRTALARDDLAPAELRLMLHGLIERISALLLGTPGAERWARFVIREQMDPSPAFDVLYERVMLQVHGLACQLLGRLRGRPPDDPVIMTEMFTIVGQILVFRVARATTQRRLGWASYTPERIGLIQAVLRRNLDAMLDAGLDAGGRP